MSECSASELCPAPHFTLKLTEAVRWKKYIHNKLWLELDIIKGRKEMFSLMTHVTHFIYGYIVSGHMVKDHSDRERGNPPHGILFLITSKGLFHMHHPRDRIAHTNCYTSRGALAGVRNSSMGVDIISSD